MGWVGWGGVKSETILPKNLITEARDIDDVVMFWFDVCGRRGRGWDGVGWGGVKSETILPKNLITEA